MQPVMIQELIGAVGGKTGKNYGKATFPEISTDSRTLHEGEVFFALCGERMNGHDYVASALERGAAAAIVSEDRGWNDDRVVFVGDTGAALLDFAGWYRRQYHPHVVGVTGSVGKTTTKEMIASVLESDGRTLKTEGNLNNQVGLPKTLLQLSGRDKYAVVEMGMSNLHEIEALSRAAAPEVGVITNIGISHLETLKSRQNILCAKLEITEGIADGGALVLGADNDLLTTVEVPRLRRMTFGITNPESDVRAVNIEPDRASTNFDILCAGGRYPAVIPCVGEHNVQNALAAFAVGLCLGLAPERMIPALLAYSPTGMRQRMVQFHNMLVIEDCYNASPDSMRAALSTLSKLGALGKRVAVFGDMLELGDMSDEAHDELGRWVAESGVELLLAYGAQCARTVAAARAAGMTESFHFDDKAALADVLVERAAMGDTILVKGSRSMAMEDVLHAFYSAR